MIKNGEKMQRTTEDLAEKSQNETIFSLEAIRCVNDKEKFAQFAKLMGVHLEEGSSIVCCLILNRVLVLISIKWWHKFK